MAFKDINAIMCEPDLMTRGRLVIELKANAVSACVCVCDARCVICYKIEQFY